jgi:hypothetical protein
MQPTSRASAPTTHRRPPPSVRAIVLVLAVASLGLTMCHRTRREVSAPIQAAPQAQVGPAPATPAPSAPEKPDPYFSATKAPGPLQ